MQDKLDANTAKKNVVIETKPEDNLKKSIASELLKADPKNAEEIIKAQIKNNKENQ